VPAEGAEHTKVMFSSVRPADYSVPYSVLEKNGVAFSAVDKRSNKLLTVLVGVTAGCLESRRTAITMFACSSGQAALCWSAEYGTSDGKVRDKRKPGSSRPSIDAIGSARGGVLNCFRHSQL